MIENLDDKEGYNLPPFERIEKIFKDYEDKFSLSYQKQLKDLNKTFNEKLLKYIIFQFD